MYAFIYVSTYSARGTICAPSKNMCALHSKKYFFWWDTHISARGTTCAPSKNMCAPAQAQNFQNDMLFIWGSIPCIISLVIV